MDHWRKLIIYCTQQRLTSLLHTFTRRYYEIRIRRKSFLASFYILQLVGPLIFAHSNTRPGISEQLFTKTRYESYCQTLI